jgi:glycosyltransferase
MHNFFSIITVVKNNSINIGLTIESVLQQKFKNFEYIIIDGCSNDGTSEIIEKYYIKNSKVKYYRFNDKGIYDALNFAISKSKGKYLGIIHSGDIYFSKNILNNVSKKIIKKDFLFGKIDFFDNDLKISRTWSFLNKNYGVNNFYKVAHPSLFIKKDIAKKIKYDPKNKISSDSKYILDLFKITQNYYYYNMPIQFMNTYGLSNNFKYFHIKMLEDIKILMQHSNFFFLFIYFKKIFSKINHYNFIRKNSKLLTK